jgi:type IV conjugative transfer system lipoprotein TraV
MRIQMMIKQKIQGKNIRNLLKLLCLGMGLMTLSACAVHKASFDCPNGKGMGCGSMIDVHKAIKDNSFESKVESRNSTKSVPGCISCQKANPANIATTTQVNNGLVIPSAKIDAAKSVVSRSQDQIMRIWFNSYFDEYNNFHDSQYIYTIIQPSQWVVNKRDIL